jgi:hypothetical protein
MRQETNPAFERGVKINNDLKIIIGGNKYGFGLSMLMFYDRAIDGRQLALPMRSSHLSPISVYTLT